MEQGLYGIKNTNRDLTDEKNWGKNQFNNAFPIALINYMGHQEIDPIFLQMNENLNVQHDKIAVSDLYNLENNDGEIDYSKLYFSFETSYEVFEETHSNVPRNDITIIDNNTHEHLTTFEIKLTAVPDNSTVDLDVDQYSAEIVVRPDTIVYLALSIVSDYTNKDLLKEILSSEDINKAELDKEAVAVDELPKILKVINKICLENIDNQRPFLLQPIWKTVKNTPKLAENCLDVFVWSDIAFTRLFVDSSTNDGNTITRQKRTTIWLYMLINEFLKSKNNQNPYSNIIDKYTYGTKNDKAFSTNGRQTHIYLNSDELKKPRITIDTIKEIVIGGGEEFLSPERRLDQAIVMAPGLFEFEEEND